MSADVILKFAATLKSQTCKCVVSASVTPDRSLSVIAIHKCTDHEPVIEALSAEAYRVVHDALAKWKLGVEMAPYVIGKGPAAVFASTGISEVRLSEGAK
ncbi:MAG: hypothetical protein LAO20_16670 [Acidobacteriia bacterium]|nr:hypothetical protein [Terriglobia bacterium]